jgi:hypothetical protein
VDVTNVETNVTVHQSTNAEGLYVVAGLKPGRYRLTITKDGFRRVDVTDLVLNVQDVLSRNFQLEVGPVLASITVVANDEKVNTTDASISTVIDQNAVQNMPLNGRSLQSLIMLAPGMVLAAPNGGNGFYNTTNPGQFSTNGERSYSNNFTLDGVSANTGTDANSSPTGFSGAQPALTSAGTTQNLVSLDSLQEFKIQTSSYAPEFGRSPGAQIEMLTRSGTNAYHGTLSEYLRNDMFDDEDWFAKGLGERTAKLRQNDFSGTFAGPVRFPGYDGRDRTFFFFSYEGLRLRQPNFASSAVPDLNMRETATADIQPLVEAFPLPTGGEIEDPFTGLPSGLAQFASGYSNPSTSDTWSLRVDHHLSDRFMVFGRYSHSTSNSKYASMAQETSTRFGSQSATVGVTALLSPHTINEFRWNFSRSSASLSYALDSLGGAVPPEDSLLFPPAYASPSNSELFFMLENDAGSPMYFAGTTAANLQHQINAVDSFSLVKGKHAMKFGVDYRRMFPVIGPAQYNQTLMFNTGSLFNPIDDLTAGTISDFDLQTQRSDLKPVFVNLSLYSQDTWRVNSRLTFTYGLRWEFNPVPHNSNGPDPDTLTGLSSPSTFALAPPGTPIYPTRYNDFAPRFGLAYQLQQSPAWQTVLRAGAGLFYDLGSSEATTAFMAYPLQASSFLMGVPYPLTQSELAPPTPTLSDADFNVYDPNFNLPRIAQWNATIEQALGKEQVLSMSYVGSTGRRLLQVYPYEGPNSTMFGVVNLYKSNSTSDYDALQVQFRRRLVHGLQALASYSWSHALDDLSNDGTFLGLSARGNSDFDIRHNFSATVSYDVPTVSSKRPVRAFLGGWGIDTIIHVQTAAPLDVMAADNFLKNGESRAVRPNIVPGVPIYLHGNVCPSLNMEYTDGYPCPGGWRINPNAFSTPTESATQFVQGDLGRNVLRGFGLSQMDLAFRRQFNLTEQIHLQFRAEAFNALDHANFGSVGNQLNSETFGWAQSMFGGAYGGMSALYQIGGPRSLQFSLKLQF